MATESLVGTKLHRIFTKDAPEFSLAIVDGVVVLKPDNPNDERQQWIIDGKYGSISKDEQGSPGFAIVNKATGLAIQHATRDKRLVQVVPYKRDYFNETVLWAKGIVEDEDGYTGLRVVYDTQLNLDSLRIPGTGFDGRHIGLWQWNNGENQWWKIVENNCELPPPLPHPKMVERCNCADWWRQKRQHYSPNKAAVCCLFVVIVACCVHLLPASA